MEQEPQTSYVAELAWRNRQLNALREATLAIASELALDKVLQKIVNVVRDLVDAEYVALGVPGEDGFLEEFVFSGMPAEHAALMPHLPRGLGLLGAIIKERHPIRIPQIAEDPRSVGFPPHHPPMASFLGVPIMMGERALGHLYMTNKKGTDNFTEADEEIVVMLAHHLAVAIQNARLYEQVGRLAVGEERSRIGMDLHDGVIQSIYAVGLTLESALLIMQEENHEATSLIDTAIGGLNDVIRDIRGFILDLQPRRFEGDLLQGLKRLVREFQANAIVAVELNVPASTLNTLPPATARAIFLTTQEALANIARHARASQVNIEIQWQNRIVTLTIQDNGRGFDVRQQVNSATGHGLSNMRVRAIERGGFFKLTSALGKGTTISMVLPIA